MKYFELWFPSRYNIFNILKQGLTCLVQWRCFSSYFTCFCGVLDVDFSFISKENNDVSNTVLYILAGNNRPLVKVSVLKISQDNLHCFLTITHTNSNNPSQSIQRTFGSIIFPELNLQHSCEIWILEFNIDLNLDLICRISASN